MFDPEKNYLETVTILDNITDGQVNGYDFYRYIFPDCECTGELNSDFSKPNAIFFYRNDDPERNVKYKKKIMLCDTWKDDYIDFVEQETYTLCSGMSYRGRSPLAKNEQRMNALIFDLDGVGGKQLRTLLLRFTLSPKTIRSLPNPTFLVVSGGGVHLYYVFDEPIDLFPNVKKQLSALKRDLTYKMWDWKSTSLDKKIQYQRIGQPFRMVGSINEKHGNEVVAYQLGDRVSIDYLNQYVIDETHTVDLQKRYESKMSLAEAKEKYPDWYERIVVKKESPKKWDIKGKVHGKDPYALYHWWLRQVELATAGHRYFFMMFCVVYGCKCDVPKDIIEKDLWGVYEKLKLVEHENPLTEEDVRSALKTYKKNMYNYKIDDIVALTGVPIEKNKRNYRTQEKHLQGARAIRDINNENWRAGNGRPKGSGTAARKVYEWRQAHANGKKIECERETGLSRPTVLKWWDWKPTQREIVHDKDGNIVVKVPHYLNMPYEDIRAEMESEFAEWLRQLNR